MNEQTDEDWEDELEEETLGPESELDIMFPGGVDDGLSLDSFFRD